MHAVPTKLSNLTSLIATMAHQPWMITLEDIAVCLLLYQKNDPKYNDSQLGSGGRDLFIFMFLYIFFMASNI